MLDKILSFKPQKTAYINTFSSANNLVTAWAMQQSGQPEDAEIFLHGWLNRESNNALAHWVMNTYKGVDFTMSDETKTDENYRVLKNLTQILSKQQKK